MRKHQNSCFKKIDIFGLPPLFTIRGQATFQTQIGSFLTIISFFLIIMYVLIFLHDMITHKSPNFYSAIYNDEFPSEINLTKNNFSFVFGLQNNEYSNFIDETIYQVKAFQYNLKQNNNGSYNYEIQKLKIIKCNQYNFQIIPEYFKNLSLNNLYCLDNDLNLKGGYMNNYWNYIKLNFSKCENSTENNNKCKNEKEINELLIDSYIGIFLPDYSFEPSKFNNPYKTYIRHLYNSFSIKYFEDIYLYLKLFEIISDSGYFFENENSIKFAAYDNIQNDISFRNENNFLSLNIRVSSKREVHKRTYIKLQTIFSNVGGMLKIILLIGEYSVYFIRMLLYKNYILEFFNLDESEIRLKEIRKKYKLKGMSSSKFKIESFFSNINENNENNLKKYNSFIDNNSVIKNNDEKSEIRSNINNDDKLITDKKQFKKENTFFEMNKNKTLKQNNFLSINFIKGKSKTNDQYLINSVLSNKMRNSNIKNKDIKDNISIKNNSIVSNENESKKSNIIHPNILRKNSLFKKNMNISRLQLRVIKVPGFFSDFVCKKNTIKTIKQVHENYKEIQFLLDIVHYLKSQNELNIIEKYLFTEDQRKILSYTYTFEADFGLERKGYDYMIKHEKNIFDEKDLNEYSQKNLLKINKNEN